LVLIDVTPGVERREGEAHHRLRERSDSFDDFDALLERTIAHNPTRSVSSLRRGILHNAVQRDDGTWVWRHQQHPRSELVGPRPVTSGRCSRS
jgi:hypothetical protein